MTHTIEKYGDIGNFSGVTFVILPFMNLKYVMTLAPTAKIIRDIPDFYVLNVPKTQPRHNPVVHNIFQVTFHEFTTWGDLKHQEHLANVCDPYLLWLYYIQ